jgi:hypothetical protein
MASSFTQQCHKEAQEYGDGHGNDSISLFCINLISSKAKNNLRAFSSSGKIKVTGLSNAIMIEKISGDSKITVDFIAGKSTGLNNIKAISIDEVNEEIIVLDNDKILFFSSIITGNVSPYRVLSNEELTNSSDIDYIPHNQSVAVFSKSKGKVFLYSRKANVAAPKGKRFLSPIETVNLNFNGNVELSVNSIDSKLYILDRETETLYSKDLKDSKQDIKVELLKANFKISNPSYIRYSYKLKKLIISNDKNESYSL